MEAKRGKHLVIEPAFDFGETVYVVTDSDQQPFQITEMTVLPGGTITYKCESGLSEKWFYDFQLSRDKNEVFKLGGGD